MDPQELYDEDRDIDFEDDVECEAEDWDEEALGLEVDEMEVRNIGREIGALR